MKQRHGFATHLSSAASRPEPDVEASVAAANNYVAIRIGLAHC
jgi:hypothetical protein